MAFSFYSHLGDERRKKDFMNIGSFLSIGEAAARLGVKPRDLTTLFYSRGLDCDRCPVIGGRRLIPADYLPGIAAELRRAGRLPALGEVTHGK